MAMSKEAIAAKILAGFVALMNDEGDRMVAATIAAASLADAIMLAVTTAEITYVTGLSSPAGPVTGMFQGTIG